MFEPIQINLDPIIIGATYDPDALIITEDGDLADLDSAAITLTIHDGDTVIKTLGEGTGITVASGVIAIAMTAAETAALTPGEYSWYLTLTVGTAVYRYSEGKVRVRK